MSLNLDRVGNQAGYHLHPLLEVSLVSCSLPVRTFSLLASALVFPGNAVQAIELCTNQFAAEMLDLDLVRVLCGVLKSEHCAITRLSIEDNMLCDEGLAWLCYAMEHTSKVRILSLGNNCISLPGIRAMCSLLEHPHCVLEDIHLNGNPILDQGAQLLADTLARERYPLYSLDLSYCGITSLGIAAIGWTLNFGPVTNLDLTGNLCNAESLGVLARGVRNQKIPMDYLAVFWNDNSMEALVPAFENLKTLSMWNDFHPDKELSDPEFETLMGAFEAQGGNCRLENLTLGAIDTPRALRLTEALPFATSLVDLRLCDMEPEALSVVLHFLASPNCHLLHVDLWDNPGFGDPAVLDWLLTLMEQSPAMFARFVLFRTYNDCEDISLMHHPGLLAQHRAVQVKFRQLRVGVVLLALCIPTQLGGQRNSALRKLPVEMFRILGEFAVG
jgi:hypothetical protein